jgi:hypothetical protein
MIWVQMGVHPQGDLSGLTLMQHTRRRRINKTNGKGRDRSVGETKVRKRGKVTHVTFELLSMLSIAHF